MGKTLRGTVLSINLGVASQNLEAALRVQVSVSPVERTQAELLLTIADALKFLADSVPPDAASTDKKG